MVALISSILVSALMAWGINWYAKRRPADQPTTWAEAMAGATYVFFLFFMVFGIVPHQWLTLAENEWSFRADKLFNPWGLITPKSQGGWFPFDVTLRVISDSVAAIIYIVFLGYMVYYFRIWQTRGEQSKKQSAIATSAYGRPLVKRG